MYCTETIKACYTTSQIQSALDNVIAADAAVVSATLYMTYALLTAPTGIAGAILIAAAAATVVSVDAWAVSAHTAYNEAAADPCCNQ